MEREKPASSRVMPILEKLVSAGATTNSDAIETFFSHCTTSSAAFSLLPTLSTSRRLPNISACVDSNKKEGYPPHSSSLMGINKDEDRCCCPDDDNVEEGLISSMLTSSDLPQYPSNNHGAPWFGVRDLTSAAELCSYLADSDLSSSLWSDDENSCRTEEDEAKYRPPDSALQQEERTMESNQYLLGSSHKSIIGVSTIPSEAMTRTRSTENIKPAPRKDTLLASSGACCNAAPYQSTLFHAGGSSLLLNHDGNTGMGAAHDDPFASVVLRGPSLNLFSSPYSSSFGSNTATQNNTNGSATMTLCQEATASAHNQQQQNVLDTKRMNDDVTDWNQGISLQLQLRTEGHRGPGGHDHLPKASVLVGPLATRRSQRIQVASKKKQANKKVDGVDSSIIGKIQVTEDQALDGESAIYHDASSLIPPEKQHQEEDMKMDPWYTHFQELVEYKAKHGHCNVPYRYKNENPFLAAWAKRQRYQYKCKIRGKHSHLTDERETLLEELGFVWDSHVAAWEENFALMAEFYRKHGHCCVPIKQKELSDWAKRQRRLYRNLRQSSKTSTTTTSSPAISEERIRRLNEIEFQWATTTIIRHSEQGRSSRNKKRKSSSSILT